MNDAHENRAKPRRRGRLEDYDGHLAALLRGPAPPWPPHWSREPQASAFVRRTGFHGIASLLADRPDLDRVMPAPIARRILERARLEALWEASHASVVAEAIDALAAKSIRCVVMKGTALAYSLYRKPAHRPRGDSDLLIERTRLDEAREALERLGFRRKADPHGVFFQESWEFDRTDGFSHTLDLHWQANDSPTLQQALRAEEFFTEAEPLESLAPGAWRPPLWLMGIQAAINEEWHWRHGYFVDDVRVCGERRLINQYDLYLVARALDGAGRERMVRAAIESEIAPILRDALEASWSRLGGESAHAMIERLQRTQDRGACVLYLREDLRAERARRDFSAIRSLRGKLAFALANLLPDRAHFEAHDPDGDRLPLALLRLRRLARIARSLLVRRIWR